MTLFRHYCWSFMDNICRNIVEMHLINAVKCGILLYVNIHISVPTLCCRADIYHKLITANEEECITTPTTKCSWSRKPSTCQLELFCDQQYWKRCAPLDSLHDSEQGVQMNRYSIWECDVRNTHTTNNTSSMSSEISRIHYELQWRSTL